MTDTNLMGMSPTIFDNRFSATDKADILERMATYGRSDADNYGKVRTDTEVIRLAALAIGCTPNDLRASEMAWLADEAVTQYTASNVARCDAMRGTR